MCGIIGTFLPEALPPGTVRSALGRLAHRGPDDEGLAGSGGQRIGVRRLAILDLERGAQPMLSDDGRVAVVHNGEIYNYVELREELRQRGRVFRTQSDTEVVLQAYLEQGDAFVESLHGMFALAILDRRTGRLLLARDRFGKKPLYYRETGPGALVFASEIKGLLPLLGSLGRVPEIRPQAIYDYLSLGVVPQPETVYHGIRALEPAHLLVADGRRIERRRYWSLAYSPKSRLSFAEARNEVRRRIARAVEIRLRSDVPLGVLLSGGIDSGVVAFEAAKRSPTRLRLFTVGVDDPRLDETGLARQTAARLGLETQVLRLSYSPVDHLQDVVAHFDQPFADPSAIPTLAVSRLARGEVTVALNGDGGDEVFAGYRRHLAATFAESLGRLPGRVTRGLAAVACRVGASRRSRLGLAARFLGGLGRPPGERYLAWTTDLFHEADKALLWKGETCRPTEDVLSDFLPEHLRGLDHQLAADQRINLLSDLLVKMDMATMAHSLEARSPLLDHRLAEFVARLPTAFQTRRATPKHLLREAYRDELPREVIDGAKRGFEVPLAGWLAGDLRQLVGDTLASPSARIGEYLDKDGVADVIAGRTLRRRNHPHLVYALLVLELWLREQGGDA